MRDSGPLKNVRSANSNFKTNTGIVNHPKKGIHRAQTKTKTIRILKLAFYEKN